MMNALKETVLKNGGITLDKTLKPFKPDNGYMVGLLGSETKTHINNDIMIGFNVGYLLNTLQQLKDKNVYLGLCLYGDTLYIELSKHYNSYERAISGGIKNRQIAIYDFKNNKDIILDKKRYNNKKEIKKDE